MYKIIYKLYDGEPVDENAKGCSPYATYITEYTSLRGAQRVLRKAFDVGAMWKEAPVSKLGDLNVVRSYYVPGFDKGINARFYIIEEDD